MKLSQCAEYKSLESRIAALENGSGVSDGDDGSTTIYPQCSNARTNFFNEQQFAWGFSIQSGNGGVDPWQYVISGANYQIDVNAISNNADFTYVEIANADGTFDHVFTGNAPLAANSSTALFRWNGVNFGFNPVSQSQSVNCG